jgi:hypothetical protein
MTDNIQQSSSDEISLKDLILKIKEWVAYLKTQWWKIAIAGILGGIIGFVYAWMQPITYTAKTTFVVEDAKSSGGLGGLASLAGQFGVDVGGGGGGGLIAGDNILLYFKSESLAREVLLSPWENLSSHTIADEYAKVYRLDTSWKKNSKIGEIKFSNINIDISRKRLYDSLLQSITKSILTSSFSINKPDKKAGFIEVKVQSKSEAWSLEYCKKIIEIAVQRYIQVKTERQQKTVDKLQARVDSISRLLNSKTNQSVALQTATATMDVNPLFRTNSAVASELTVRDKTMLATVYSEVVKNLEFAKFTLSQETPVIQVVDSSLYPLVKNKKSRLIAAIQLSIVFSFISVLIFVIKKYL